MALASGTRLGSYVIVGPLGAGGMGEVYLARDTRLGREVAIKVLPEDVAADPDRLTRFEREARVVSALNHPHIVTLHEVGTSDSGPYLVLERIDGRSLREMLDDGPLPLRRLLTLGTQIAEGLAKAHAAGIVHRDLKPGNVMVTTDGFAKVLDFGLAKLVHPELDANAMDAATTLAKDTATGLVLGTVGYLSPEQASGKAVDYRADQFALGALLYEMATRERPFRRGTLVESLAATIAEDVEPLRLRRPDAPAPLEWLIERCLSKDPSDRYASTADLARELASLRDHLSDLTRMPSGEMTAGARPRHWWRSRTALAVVAVAIAAGGFAAARLTTETGVPSYRPLTFTRGSITGARFGPDGKTVYYSAIYGDGPPRVYQTNVDRIESKLLEHVSAGVIQSVSATQELAVVLTEDRQSLTAGTLVRVPNIGGTPRPLAEGATFADWAPDGERLAIIRAGRCEFPIGTVIAPRCTMVRVSPQGDKVAMLFSPSPFLSTLEVQDLSGRALATFTMPFIYGLAWSPDGREVWFTGSDTGSPHNRALYAINLKGVRRLIASMPGAMTIYDIARDGSALIATGAGWTAVNAARLNGEPDLPLDLLGRSEIVGLSTDGKWVLTNESRDVGRGAYLRLTDGSDPIPFPGRFAVGLSPDGTSILVRQIDDPRQLTLISAATGKSDNVSIPAELETTGSRALWSRDGRRLFMWMRPPQLVDGRPAPARLYMREGEKAWQAITPAMPQDRFAVSRDGRAVAIREQGGEVVIYSTDGAAPRRVDGERGKPIHWSDDGQLIYFLEGTRVPTRVYRRHIATGRVEPWRTIGPPDRTGVSAITEVFIAQGEQFYVYQYGRVLNDLYLARDLR